MNIAAVVILYHPDQETFENILSYCLYVNKLYIADNSETSHQNHAQSILRKKANTTYIHDGKNKGIAERLNQVCKMAKLEGHDYLLTMDQDSSFKEDVIKRYFQCFHNHPDKEKVSMFGVQYENPQWASDICNPTPWTTLITSGSIVNLAIFQSIGGFDEKLFIDTVDFEYCFRSIKRGFQVILFKNILLTHRLGITQMRKSGENERSRRVTLHSPVRLYYMVRNYLYLQAIYRKDFPTEMLKSRNAVINRIKVNLLHNKNKIVIMRAVLKAVADVKRKRMGKYRNK